MLFSRSPFIAFAVSEMIGSFAKRLSARMRRGAARQRARSVGGHRQRVEALVGLDLLEQLEAAHLRQLEIQPHAVEPAPLEQLESLLGRPDADDLDVVAAPDQLADRVALLL